MKETDYLKMQKTQYNSQGRSWDIDNKDAFPVGKFNEHNAWEDYDKYLFKGIPEDTRKQLKVLEYGCGPGRNIVKYRKSFKRVDGVDISEVLIEKAKQYTQAEKINSSLKTCDGKSIPFDDSSYDSVFSVICLQHIASFEIRDSILREIYRVLKDDGKLFFQMGFGGSSNNWVKYYDDKFDASKSNGAMDVSVTDPSEVIDHLSSIGFKNIEYSIENTGPNCKHKNWIWFEAQK